MGVFTICCVFMHNLRLHLIICNMHWLEIYKHLDYIWMLWFYFFPFWGRGMGLICNGVKLMTCTFPMHMINHTSMHILNCLRNTAGASPTSCRLVVHHACCTRMQGDMQCSLTCRRVCVCAGHYYCCRQPLRLQYACLLKVI